MGVLLLLAIIVGVYLIIVGSLNSFIDYIFRPEKNDCNTYIDKSTHTHFHVHTDKKSKEIENYINSGDD